MARRCSRGVASSALLLMPGVAPMVVTLLCVAVIYAAYLEDGYIRCFASNIVSIDCVKLQASW